MRTRRESYPSASDGITYAIRPLPLKKRRQADVTTCGKPRNLNRLPSSKRHVGSGFDALPDDLLICILSAVVSSATRASDFVNAMLTCRRFCAAATHSEVLANASTAALVVRADKWSDGAFRFLKQCADAGNIEACYTLGMIRFYCHGHRAGGASLMAKAAMQLHAGALHSLAVIQFNGSGGSRKDKDLKAGVALCVRAATLGHVDAMRELGHCLQDGYGVLKNILEGRRLLLEANAREAAAAAVSSSPRSIVESAMQLAAGSRAALGSSLQGHRNSHVSPVRNSITENKALGDEPASPLIDILDAQMFKFIEEGSGALLSDYGCTVPAPKLHIANRFLVEWFRCNPPASGLRLCSHGHCGRPETRRHEFRRCSACGFVNYCSRACQALDWKIRHKLECHPVADWEVLQEDDVEDDDQIAFDDAE